MEHVFRLNVKSVDIVQPAIESLRDNWQREKTGAVGIGFGCQAGLHLPSDDSIAHHADTMSIGDHDRPVDKSRLLDPGGPGHLAVTVLREPAREDCIVVAFTARQNRCYSSAHAVAGDQRAISYLDASHIGDGVPRPWRSIKRHAQIPRTRL